MPTEPSLTLVRRLKAPPAKVYAAWTDTHLGTPATGRQDVAFAAATLGSGRSGVATGIIVALLLLIGAVTLFTLRSRRSGASPAPQPAVPSPAVAEKPGVTGR